MAHDQLDNLDGVSTDEVFEDAEATLIDHRFTHTRSSPVELAITQYADSLERLHSAGLGSADNQYTRGFVAGLRAAAKVAATVAGS
jgi:hypothetical protein